MTETARRNRKSVTVPVTRSRTSASLSPSPTSENHTTFAPSIQQTMQQQQQQLDQEDGSHVESDSNSEEQNEPNDDQDEQEIQDQLGMAMGSTTPTTPNTTPPTPSDAHLRRLKIRKLLLESLGNLFCLLPYLLLPISLLLPLLLTWPQKPISRNIYVDENALQPAQANLYFDSFQVAWTHSIYDHLQDLHSHQQRINYVSQELARYGLEAREQHYSFDSTQGGNQDRNSGTNVYAKWSAPRTNGREAIILNAAWKSKWRGELTDEYDTIQIKQRRQELEHKNASAVSATMTQVGENRINNGGVAMLLSMAKYLSTQSHLSKDIIFVISEGHLEGMHAWTSAYFGKEQPNLQTTPLTLSSSLVHSSISVDSPLLTFSSFQPLLTGLNGLTPNLDVYNTFQRILSRVGSFVDSGGKGYGTTIPIRFSVNEERKWGVTYNVADSQKQRAEREEREQLREHRIWEWNLKSNRLINRMIGQSENESVIKVGEKLENWFRLGQRGLEKLRRSNGNLWREGFKMVRGTTDGPSGVLNRFHVDSFTVHATPDPEGPYRTKELGRVLESQIRSMSNLLERLHHSQFFYFLASPNTFIQIGLALPCALLLSAALTIQGLKRWSKEGASSSRSKMELFERTKIEVEDLIPSTSSFNKSFPSQYQSVENLTTDHMVESLLDCIPGESLKVDQSLTFKIRQRCRKFKLQVSEIDRPVGQALGTMTACCALGVAISMILRRENCDAAGGGMPQLKKLNTSIVVLITSSGLISRFGVSLLPTSTLSSRRALASIVHSFNLLYTGALILSISLLNLPLAYALGVLAGVPMLLFGPSTSSSAKQSSTLIRLLKVGLSTANLPPVLFYLVVLSSHPSLAPLRLERFNLLLHFLPPTPPSSQASGFFQLDVKDIYGFYCQAVRESNTLGGVGIDVVGAVWTPLSLLLLVSNLV